MGGADGMCRVGTVGGWRDEMGCRNSEEKVASVRTSSSERGARVDDRGTTRSATKACLGGVVLGNPSASLGMGNPYSIAGARTSVDGALFLSIFDIAKPWVALDAAC